MELRGLVPGDQRTQRVADEYDPVVPHAVHRTGPQALDHLVDRVRVRRDGDSVTGRTAARADAESVDVDGGEPRGVRGSDVGVGVRPVREIPVVLAVRRTRDEDLNRPAERPDRARRVTDVAGEN